MNYYSTKYLVKPLLFTAAIAAIAISTTMNARFGYSLGQDQINKNLLAGFSISLDIFKAFSLAASIGLLASRKRANKVMGSAAMLVWTVGVIWSLVSSFGFYASNAIATEARATEINQSREIAKADMVRLSQELAAIRSNKRYAWTAGCTHVVQRQSRELCRQYDKKTKSYRKVAVIFAKTSLITPKPQIVAFRQITGASDKTIKTTLGMMFSVFSEIFTALAMVIAFAPFSKRKTVRKLR